ncbi:MAG: hypothetical protein Q9219_007206, partial [cf. Caloplaca sp. 3 TL-2023]
MDNHLVTFRDGTTWQLVKKISEKGWQGSIPSQREKCPQTWSPCEAHAVYECVQRRGPQIGMVAIMKIRIEVPYDYPPSDDPQERAKEASGMRLNFDSRTEIDNLERLTAAGCSATPSLLGVKIDVQDESILHHKATVDNPDSMYEEDKWWMPGGYIVYILMEKLSAQPLSINTFWNEEEFTRQDRDDIRTAFQKSF